MMEKRPLIVFSGGMDSTYMLLQALQEGDVYTCYIKANQHPYKTEIELQARKKIIAFLEEFTKHKVIRDTVIDLSQLLWQQTVPDATWGQAHVWLFGLLFVSDGNRHSKVCIGNVLGDSIAGRLANMQVAWNETQKFSKNISVPLSFLWSWCRNRLSWNVCRLSYCRIYGFAKYPRFDIARAKLGNISRVKSVLHA